MESISVELRIRGIKNLSMILIIISTLIIFINLSAFLIWSFFKVNMAPDASYEYLNFGDEIIGLILGNFHFMFLGLVVFALLLLFASIYLKKLKLWANKSISYLASILALLIFIFFAFLIISFYSQKGFSIFLFIPMIIPFIVSSPLIYLVFYLNKASIKKYFR